MADETVIIEAEQRGVASREVHCRTSPPDPRDARNVQGGAARITISHKIGWSTQFGREKGDVMMSVELPCGTSDDAIARAVQRAKGLLDEHLPKQLDHLVDTYFGGGPIVFGSGKPGGS
jgi:hypothetical protein